MTSPVKSCSLDPVPTFLVSEYVDVLLSYITRMVNPSLSQGRLPVSQKHAIVTPLLKKTGLDSSDMNNFRPVSNLSFISKVVEQVVTSQLHQYLAANDLLSRFQSAYRKYHSIETAMQRIWSDILVAADDRQVTLLGLLDLSAAFDCVDHSMLLERLQSAFGLTDLVHDWVQSFLTDRTQQIAYSGQLSFVQSVLFVVPQGSVLGPLLYVLYTAELALVVDRHGLSLHQYADDTQDYIGTPAGEYAEAAVRRLTACLVDIEAWLKASRLRLNPTKTQVMWLGSLQQLAKVNVSEVPVASARINVSETARNLGIIVDSQLTLSVQVAAVCRSGYYQLWLLRPLVRSMSSDAVKMLIQAFISCRLHYFNSMFYGITDGLMSGLQSVQNAAARLVSGARRYDHMTPMLQELHWFPVRRQVDFKMATLVYLSLSGMAPAYLVAECQLVSDEGRRHGCVLPTRGHVSSDGPAAAMETDALLLQVLGCGTVCQFI